VLVPVLVLELEMAEKNKNKKKSIFSLKTKNKTHSWSRSWVRCWLRSGTIIIIEDMINVNIMLKQLKTLIQWRWRSSRTILTRIDLDGKGWLASTRRGNALASTNHHRRLITRFNVICFMIRWQTLPHTIYNCLAE